MIRDFLIINYRTLEMYRMGTSFSFQNRPQIESIDDRSIVRTFIKNGKHASDPGMIDTVTGERIDLRLLQKSVEYSGNILEKPDIDTIANNYLLLCETNKVTPDNTDLEERLDSRKRYDSVSDDQSKRYDIIPIIHESFIPGSDMSGVECIDDKNKIDYCVFFRDITGLCLFYEKFPTEVMSFYADNHNSLVIRHIQGINGIKTDEDGKKIRLPNRGMDFFMCDDVLLDISEGIASRIGLERSVIIGYKNCEWVNNGHITSERGRKRYDDFAERMGYGLESDGNWYKELK